MADDASSIDAHTLAAYRAARYVVPGVKGFVLSVDQYSPRLEAAHRRHEVGCSAFLTAFNPRGQQLDGAENLRRHTDLQVTVAAMRLSYRTGFGVDPEHEWPEECSVLVFGLALEPACMIGRHFEQNALIWAGSDAVPRLVLLR